MAGSPARRRLAIVSALWAAHPAPAAVAGQVLVPVMGASRRGVGYIDSMKVTDILRVKGNTLYTVSPDKPLLDAIDTMAELDIGSLVVMEHGDVVGMLTFREVIGAVAAGRGSAGTRRVRSVMDDAPLTCTPETGIDEVRRMMLARHARYMPVLDQRTLMGVISFYDVAKTVVDAQDFENRLLKAYIRDWPEQNPDRGSDESGAPSSGR
jgi:CBS domain-containing protein